MNRGPVRPAAARAWRCWPRWRRRRWRRTPHRAPARSTDRPRPDSHRGPLPRWPPASRGGSRRHARRPRPQRRPRSSRVASDRRAWFRTAAAVVRSPSVLALAITWRTRSGRALAFCSRLALASWLTARSVPGDTTMRLVATRTWVGPGVGRGTSVRLSSPVLIDWTSWRTGPIGSPVRVDEIDRHPTSSDAGVEQDDRVHSSNSFDGRGDTVAGVDRPTASGQRGSTPCRALARRRPRCRPGRGRPGGWCPR